MIGFFIAGDSMTTPTAEKITTVSAYVASGGAMFFGLTANEFAAFAAALVAILTFFVNIWFKWQHLKIVRKAAKARPDGVICELPE